MVQEIKIDKLDNGKLRWDLLPIECVEDVVKVITMGANKYAPNNWQTIDNAEERFYAALLRHLSAWRQGETKDPESGLSHLAHIMCNLTFLLWFEKSKEKAKELKQDSAGSIDLGLKFLRRKGTTTRAKSAGNEFMSEIYKIHSK
jgi:hypothetical protein